MKKYLTMCGVSLGTIMLLSGCGTKTISCDLKTEHEGYANGRAMMIMGKEIWRSPSAGYNVKTRNTHVLQNAAQLTLDEGYKYFAFAGPNGDANNYNGSMINTAEGFKIGRAHV